MSDPSELPERDRGPRKIALPNRSESGKTSHPKKKKTKPGWLLPVGLISLLGIGLVAIFTLKPGNNRTKETEISSENSPIIQETEQKAEESNRPRTFVVLTPDELKALKEQATQAVANQAGVGRAHRFQDLIFGKAASLLADADAEFGQSNFNNAQLGYEEVLETVDTLTESYEVADEISDLKSRIQGLVLILEEKAASLLLSETYKTAKADLVDSDEQLQEGKFIEALDQLKKTEETLNFLIQDGETQFQEAVREALKALNSGDGDTAKSHLSIARDLRPNDPFVARQLARAEVIERVFDHFNQGIAFEQQGQFGSARVEYQKAIELDPDSVNINSRLQAINQTLNKDLFKETLAAGLEMLGVGNGDAAVEHLQKATALMPTDSQARAALEEARELQRRQTVERLLSQGKQALAEAEWGTGRTAFRKVLDFEPASSEAQSGLATAEEQIAREEQLKAFLEEAETFEKNGELEKALIVLREGRQVADPSGVITEKIKLLEGILDEKSYPQKVKILSDNQTEIQILKVGKFKPSKELQLELRPGEYTIVGTRLMYRDVRHTLVVEVGETPNPVTVVCQEKL